MTSAVCTVNCLVLERLLVFMHTNTELLWSLPTLQCNKNIYVSKFLVLSRTFLLLSREMLDAELLSLSLWNDLIQKQGS